MSPDPRARDADRVASASMAEVLNGPPEPFLEPDLGLKAERGPRLLDRALGMEHVPLTRRPEFRLRFPPHDALEALEQVPKRVTLAASDVHRAPDAVPARCGEQIRFHDVLDVR